MVILECGIIKAYISPVQALHYPLVPDLLQPSGMPMISKQSADHYTWGNNCEGWHLVRTPDLSVIQEHMPPRTSEVPHTHDRARQFFFVLGGTLSIEIGGKVQTLEHGEGLEIPPGVAHRVFNGSRDSVEFLVISQPPGQGDRAETRTYLPV